MSDWTKAFPIASVTRVDLLKWGFPEDHVAHLTDEDMTTIAQRMAGLYLADERGFWSDLESVTKDILHGKEQTLELNRDFPISSVSRADLVSAGFSQDQVAFLTDDDMQQIAAAMADVYCDHGYWEDVELCTNRLLEAKEEASHGD